MVLQEKPNSIKDTVAREQSNLVRAPQSNQARAPQSNQIDTALAFER